VARRFPPDLILLDVMMPGMDGFETCRRLRAMEHLHDVPVIFISALDEVSDKVAAFRAGGNDYVTKPFQPEEVLARVSTHIRLYRMGRALHEREESLRRNVAELETVNRKLVAMSAQLAQAEKQAAVGQLAAGVAHEINNPVGFILSNLGTLENYSTQLIELVGAYGDAESLLPVPVAQALASRRETADLAFLREDIRALIRESKVGAGRIRDIVGKLQDASRDLDDAIQLTELNDLVDNALADVWQERPASVDLVKAYGELPQVNCMPARIGQAIANILRNAFQAMPQGGQLTIRTDTDGDNASISVADTGPGIAPDMMSRVFDPFFTTRPVGQGTGLGLSVARGIANRHGGDIDVVSSPGVGSTFTLWVPVHHLLSGEIANSPQGMLPAR
jgi:signal transduction histidine kinase